MRRFAIALTVALTTAATSQAAIQTFTSSTAFYAALGSVPYTLEGYQGSAPNTLLGAAGSNSGTYNGLGYTFSSPTFGASQGIGRIDDIYNAFGNPLQSLGIWRESTAGGEGSFESYFYPGESVTVNFGQGIYAVGIFFNAEPAVAGDFTITTSVGMASNSTTPEVGDGGPSPTLYFVGLISDTPFTSATFGGSINAVSGFNLDNLVFANQSIQQIPEPATLMVLGGLLGFGGLAYRRKKAVA